MISFDAIVSCFLSSASSCSIAVSKPTKHAYMYLVPRLAARVRARACRLIEFELLFHSSGCAVRARGGEAPARLGCSRLALSAHAERLYAILSECNSSSCPHGAIMRFSDARLCEFFMYCFCHILFYLFTRVRHPLRLLTVRKVRLLHPAENVYVMTVY